MKTKPPTDAEVREAMNWHVPGSTYHMYLSDLLRCRRALRRIHRVTDDSLARRIAAEAIGKGGRG